MQSDDARVSQSGAWTLTADAAADGGSYLVNTAATDVLTIESTGPYFEVIFLRGAGYGTFAIEIDNSVVRTVVATDSAASYDQRSVIDYLSDAPHTARIYPVSGAIAIDAFVTVPYTPPPSVGGNSVEGPPDTPDERILYLCQNMDDASDRPLCLFGSNVSSEIAAGTVSSHAWGPDGEVVFIDDSLHVKIAIEDGNGDWSVDRSCDASAFVVINGSTQERPTQFAWSPNGDVIALQLPPSLGSGLYLLDASLPDATCQFTPFIAASNLINNANFVHDFALSSPTWLLVDDGLGSTKIAFVLAATDDNGLPQYAIVMANVDTAHVANGFVAAFYQQSVPELRVTLNTPDWSPDGAHIAFGRRDDFFHDVGAGLEQYRAERLIYTVNVSTGAATQVSSSGTCYNGFYTSTQLDTNPDWSADGTRLLFQRVFDCLDFSGFDSSPPGEAGQTTPPSSGDSFVEPGEFNSAFQSSLFEVPMSGGGPGGAESLAVPDAYEGFYDLCSTADGCLCKIQLQDVVNNSNMPTWLYDMRAGVYYSDYIPVTPQMDDIGLHVHTAPGINTPKLSPSASSTSAGDFVPLWGNGQYVAWDDENLIIDGKLELGRLVWYKVLSFTRTGNPFGNRITLPDSAWIMVQVLDENGDVELDFIETIGYVGPDRSTPCEVNDYTGDITFYYDRNATAYYAQSHTASHASGVIPPAGIVNGVSLWYAANGTNELGRVTSDLRGDNRTIPYADFAYAKGNLMTGTSSARFTSEGLWMGGFPMAAVAQVVCASATTDGWYFCPNTIPNVSQGLGSTDWRNHPNLRGTLQFTEIGYIYAGSTNNPNPINQGQRALETVFQFTDGGRISNRRGTTSNATTRFILLNMLYEANLQFLRIGDYAQTIRTDGMTELQHGMIIAGWGPVYDCKQNLALTLDLSSIPVSISAPALYNTLEEASSAYGGSEGGIVPVVPYVVDFSGWIGTDPSSLNNQGDRIINTQTPLPRPFYCYVFSGDGSSANFPNGRGRQNIAFGWWDIHFYAAPDTISVPVTDLQNYANTAGPDSWTWTDAQVASGFYNVSQPNP